MSQIKIAIVDDQVLFRKGLRSILENEKDLKFVLEAGNGQELLDYLESDQENPEVVLLDLSMPVLNGVETMKVLHKKYPQIKVLILSVYSEDRFISHLMEMGISGYLLKNSEPQEVIEGIRTVLIKDLYFNEALLSAIAKRINGKKSKMFIQNNSPSILSPREIEVLSLICHQKTGQEIADELFLSVRTVEGHRNNLLEKTGARNTAGLVIYAVKNQLLDPAILLK